MQVLKADHETEMRLHVTESGEQVLLQLFSDQLTTVAGSEINTARRF